MSKITDLDQEKNQDFQGFWKECKTQIANVPTYGKTVDSLLTDYNKQIAHMLSETELFQNFLRKIPVIIAVIHWAKEQVADKFLSKHFLPKIVKLLKKQLIPIKDSHGDFISLDYFMKNEHHEILENIRCVREWSILEKEEIVQCYIQFTHSLEKQTLGIITHISDPDRERVRYKKIKYEQFIEFVQNLSERDSLIAKLLYFGAPSLDEILVIKGEQINMDNFSIKFNKCSVTFPRHIMQDIKSHTPIKAKKLVFTNLRGTEVERAHLNQSFMRACKKIPKETKITPGSLLKAIGEFNE